jgi:hypothetical protein
MTKYDWSELVERYIVRGETPNLPNPWDVEEAETFLRRPYYESGAPAALRQELIKVLSQTVQKEELLVLSRGLRLTKLIPHSDFAPTLQEIFFIARSRSRKGENSDKYKEISLLAIKALYAHQPTLLPSDERRPFWEAMWISLLKDKEYAIPAYNGLRHLDISLALQQLPLLLRHSDLTPQDLGVILRGTNRDLLSKEIDLKEALIETVARLTEEELLKYQPLLRATFGGEIIDAVIGKAREDEEEELKRDITLLVPPPEGQAIDSLRKQLFPKLASRLKERISVFGASVWLVDRDKERVHFMGQAGLHDPEPEPPTVMKFGENVTGTVAKSREHLLRDLDSNDGVPVYKQDELRSLYLRGVFSVFVQVNGDRDLPLELVVNFFDASLEKLRHLRDTCIRNAGVVARTAQYALAKYTDYRVANLTTRLTEEPVLTGASQTFCEAISKALPSEEERVALYLYHYDLRRLFLYAVYNSHTEKMSFKFRPSEESPSCPLDERVSEHFSKQTSALRIFDITDTNELTIAITPDRSHLELDNLREDQGISYLGVPLREPATSGFVGRLIGLVEKYRFIKKRGGRVFTPIGEYILTELVKPAAQPLVNALDQELRLYGPIISQVKEQVGSRKRRIGDVTSVFQTAIDEFRADANDLLDSWYVTDEAERIFFSFRTLYDKCTSYWAKRGPKFGESEVDARRALHQAILTHDDLPMWSEIGVPITSNFLTRLGISDEHVDILSPLGIVLVPLIRRGRPDGLIGLEFDSTDGAKTAVEEIKKEQEGATRFVRTSMMRIWLDHRRHLLSLFATFLELFSKEAEVEGWVGKWEDFFNFVARGRADLPPFERSFGELTAGALKRLSSDSKCVFSEECSNWREFAKSGQLNTPNIGAIQLIAMPSAVRMVLATSTASILWGGTANISLVEEERPGWSQLKISVPTNGNGHSDIKKQLLALAKLISEYRGWICGSEDDENGITIMLPHLFNKANISSC